ncbi:MogA/MoaB family molybdenum cofactor biosynthesis protein [Nocardiopsis rhodophaea]|uniref:MogA/MoaB family molybdenum cofactor biosynthesis protein n=1 Tax=Nocardiopsis rhodophaea TaxID=280238 RepID=A0ABP5EZ48_9ACTN
MSRDTVPDGAERGEGADAAAPVRRVAVITASNRAAAGVYPDRSGPILVEELKRAGFAVEGPWVVPDGAPVAEALRRALAEGYDAAITTGGTGLTPGDDTPEATRPLLVREIPGIPEALRSAGRDKGVPTALLSRGLAGIAERGEHRMLVVNLPGSSGGVRDGMEVLRPILGHAIDQMGGGDHPRSS